MGGSRNNSRTGCYRFATQLAVTGGDRTERQEGQGKNSRASVSPINPYKSHSATTALEVQCDGADVGVIEALLMLGRSQRLSSKASFLVSVVNLSQPSPDIATQPWPISRTSHYLADFVVLHGVSLRRGLLFVFATIRLGKIDVLARGSASANSINQLGALSLG